jgi:hypothetical protein
MLLVTLNKFVYTNKKGVTQGSVTPEFIYMIKNIRRIIRKLQSFEFLFIRTSKYAGTISLTDPVRHFRPLDSQL